MYKLLRIVSLVLFTMGLTAFAGFVSFIIIDGIINAPEVDFVTWLGLVVPLLTTLGGLYAMWLAVLLLRK